MMMPFVLDDDACVTTIDRFEKKLILCKKLYQHQGATTRSSISVLLLTFLSSPNSSAAS